MTQQTPRVRVPFTTRWNDNDQYGHLNNTVYYTAMDTATNRWMIEHAGLDPLGDAPIALVVTSTCDFHASASFPEPLEVGLGIARLGTTSVTWSLQILRPGEETPIATGRFVHVFVDATTRQPVAIPPRIRAAMVESLISV